MYPKINSAQTIILYCEKFEFFNIVISPGSRNAPLAIGFASETSTFWLDNDLKFLIALAVMIVILLVRPQGILGVRERLG